MSIRRVVLAIARLGLLCYFSVKIRTSSSGIIIATHCDGAEKPQRLSDFFSHAASHVQLRSPLLSMWVARCQVFNPQVPGEATLVSSFDVLKHVLDRHNLPASRNVQC